MLRKTKNSEKGFTIIEVMIVLAIAGLILLIVFLAVPALQRSSRNTQRKNDVSSVLAAVSNYISNNGGTLPTTLTTTGTNTVNLTTTGTGANKEPAQLGYYTSGNVRITTTPPTPPVGVTKVVVVTGYTCNSTNTAIGTANGRSAVALFELEPATNQCQEQ